jgi:hypothetical protein
MRRMARDFEVDPGDPETHANDLVVGACDYSTTGGKASKIR